MAVTSTVLNLNYLPRDWQKECHLARKRFTVLALHRRAGKTELALRELIDAALRNTLELSLYFYVAPLLKQAKAIAWTRLKQIVAPLVIHGLATVNESELWVRFSTNGAVIRIYGADLPDAMRGVRLDGVVMDEVAQMAPTVWQDIVQPALADRMGWALFIGTPNGVNLFSDLFYRARELAGWHSALYTVYDTEALDTQEVARLRASMPEQSFAREFLCDFSAAGDAQLLSLTDIEEATRKTLRVDQFEWAPRILGVDPARFGDDRSVIMRRQGLATWKPRIYRGMDNMTLASCVADEIINWKPDAVFIDAGNGSGVIDRLRQLGHDVVEVNFGGKPTKLRFINKRTEMWWDMREWIMAGGTLPNIVDLKQDLAAPCYRFDLQDRIALESKDDIKARGLPSPDIADALALTFAMPVRKAAELMPGARSVQAEVLHYNPLDTSVLDYSPIG